MGENEWESFQILQNGDWNATIYPSIVDGSPFVKHELRGPDKKGHGRNFTIGRSKQDKGREGTCYKIRFSPNEYGHPARVTWDILGEEIHGLAERERLAEQ